MKSLSLTIAVLCGLFLSTLWSQGSRTVDLTFHNHTNRMIDLVWRSSHKGDLLYHQMQPGEEFVQPTYPGQRWYTADSQTRRFIKLYTAGPRNQSIEIGRRAPATSPGNPVVAGPSIKITNTSAHPLKVYRLGKLRKTLKATVAARSTASVPGGLGSLWTIVDADSGAIIRRFHLPAEGMVTTISESDIHQEPEVVTPVQRVIPIVNNTPFAIDVFEGAGNRRIHHGVIEPGKTVQEKCVVGDTWSFYDVHTKTEVLSCVINAEMALMHVTPTALPKVRFEVHNLKHETVNLYEILANNQEKWRTKIGHDREHTISNHSGTRYIVKNSQFQIIDHFHLPVSQGQHHDVGTAIPTAIPEVVHHEHHHGHGHHHGALLERHPMSTRYSDKGLPMLDQTFKVDDDDIAANGTVTIDFEMNIISRRRDWRGKVVNTVRLFDPANPNWVNIPPVYRSTTNPNSTRLHKFTATVPVPANHQLRLLVRHGWQRETIKGHWISARIRKPERRHTGLGRLLPWKH